MSFPVAMLLAPATVLALFVAMILVPAMIGAFLRMLPYLLVLGLLWWVFR